MRCKDNSKDGRMREKGMTLHEFLWRFGIFVLGLNCGIFLTALIAAGHREDFEEDERKNIPPTGSESKDENQAE